MLESVRATEGDAPLGRLYSVYGEHIHHQGDRTVSAADLLTEAGLDPAHAAAADDESWDTAIQASMGEGLDLTGNDVDGKRSAFFGPVISRRLPLETGLQLWDGLVLVAPIDGFWELKRTRTENPDFTVPS